MAKKNPPKASTTAEHPSSPEPEIVPIGVGDVVHFMDRQRFVDADERGGEAQPWAAMVTRLHGDGYVDLAIYEPEGGAVPRRRVPFSPILRPEHWTARPLPTRPVAEVKAADLVEALQPIVEAAVAEQLEKALATAKSDL